jgi:hypothetical protein
VTDLWGVVNGDCSVNLHLSSLEFAMRTDEAIMRCACFIGGRRGGKPVIGGTAFFVELDETACLVLTAGHVIDMVKKHCPGSPVILWFSTPDEAHPIEEMSTDPDDWLGHPDKSANVDAVVCKKRFPIRTSNHLVITRQMFITDRFIRRYDVGAGDDLYFPGLFVRHALTAHLDPILRVGTVASMPRDLVKSALGPTHAYLAEVRSIGGFSGSPVFLHMDTWRVTAAMTDDVIPELPVGDAFFGLIHGHFDTTATLSGNPLDLTEVNMGIAVIAPAQRILEVIDQPEVEKMRKKSKRAKDSSLAPTMDFDSAIVADSPMAATADLMGRLLGVPKDEADEIHRGHEG